MRTIRLLVILVISALAGAVFVTPAGAAVPVRYVTLGDSYSSGLGAGSNYSGGTCDRSPAAFSALWSAAHSPAAYLSVACAGATTTSVISTQLPSVPPDTTLISITAGGNDVGFTNIMTTCVLQGTSACVAAVNSAEAVATGKLPGLLSSAYNAIATRAPNAKVVVLSYPLFYQLHTFFCIGLSETSRAKIDEGINLVDGITAAAVVGRRGFVFADVRSAFVGHQLCSGSKWLHSLDLADLPESYHPTAAGQSGGYLTVFTAVVSSAAAG